MDRSYRKAMAFAAVVFGIGLYAGSLYTHPARYYLTRDLYFVEGDCKEKAEMVNGKIISKGWWAIDSTHSLYFSNFDSWNKVGCEDFYVMFAKHQ